MRTCGNAKGWQKKRKHSFISKSEINASSNQKQKRDLERIFLLIQRQHGGAGAQISEHNSAWQNRTAVTFNERHEPEKREGTQAVGHGLQDATFLSMTKHNGTVFVSMSEGNKYIL